MYPIKKNSCFFNTTSFWGGGEKWHVEAALMTQKKGIPTFFVANQKSIIKEKIGATTIQPFYINATKFSFLNPFKIIKLVRFFKKNNIEILVFNSPNDLKLGGIAAYFAKTPTVVYRRGIAVKVKKTGLNQWLFKKVVTHFIFNSCATKKLVELNFSAVLATKKTALIYNAIAFPEKLIENKKTPNSPFIIGNAGRLVAQKGHHFLIEIGKILNKKQLNFKILIAGEGPLFDELHKEIIKNKLQNKIELLGFVSDMDSFMNTIDVFVSTAKWEGFGFVLAEAMTHKKPTMAFNISSNPELIINEKTGYLISPFEVNEFAEKLIYLEKNRSEVLTLGENAYNFAKENFEKEKQFDKFLTFVQG